MSTNYYYLYFRWKYLIWNCAWKPLKKEQHKNEIFCLGDRRRYWKPLVPDRLWPRVVVIYEALCIDVAQGQMNGAPNETRIHSCRFVSLACQPLYHQRCPLTQSGSTCHDAIYWSNGALDIFSFTSKFLKQYNSKLFALDRNARHHITVR